MSMDPHKYRLVCAVGLVLAAAGCTRESAEPPPELSPAAAPRTPPRPGCTRHFEAFDADADGRVSRVEFFSQPHARGDARTLFDARDRNDDGYLTRNELCSGWRPGPGKQSDSRILRRAGGMTRVMHCDHHFATFDENADGSVSLDELSAWPHAVGDPVVVFEARDHNRDGSISKREFCSAWSRSVGAPR
jgi:Ca2+-binding EF-hand superfamily protein